MIPLLYKQFKTLLWILAIIFCLASCSLAKNLIQEDELVVTRAYAGNFKSAIYHPGTGCIIVTSSHIYILPYTYRVPLIPEHARCYIKLVPESHVGNELYYTGYLSFDGSDSLFYYRQNTLDAFPY